MSDLRNLLQIACAAVDQAASLVNRMAVGEVRAKGDRDMVSAIDLAVEERVRNFLAKETPELGFLGEEEGSSLPAKELTWVLDPVDGTANLVNGIPLCAVSLGLVSGGTSVLGVIDLPFLTQRFTAAQGHGAHAGATPLAASSINDLSQAVVAIGDYAVGASAQERNRLRFAITHLLAERVLRVRMVGSAAIDLAWVASGKLDASIAMSNHPWDMAAGTAIAREAGALVLDASGTEHDLLSSSTVAVAPELRLPLLHLLDDARAMTRNPVNDL
ncbi:inositol monophosphatase family protein [Streptomyces sp. NPDC046994]|uniref:inositol monophosphatase family protein n=1 Tax=Streptomyces sp. NPDC046994 TaxID=3155735 RepID=UPI00345332F9